MREDQDAVCPVHPLPLRSLHWINAGTMLAMIGSGLAIQNSEPVVPFVVPPQLTLGDDLTAALQWHLAMMWLLGLNGLAYLAFGIWSGRFRRKLLPVSLRGVLRDVARALKGRLSHDDLSVYNQVQRVMYLGVIALGVLAVLSGLSLWKPVQLSWLLALMDDFDTARIIHFACMSLILGFTLVHVGMALLVPRSMRLMVLGGNR